MMNFTNFAWLSKMVQGLSLRSLFKGDDVDYKRGCENVKKQSWMTPVTHGYYLVEDRSWETEPNGIQQPDSLVVQREEIENLEIWFYSLSDFGIGDTISSYMQSHLFGKQLKENQIRSRSKETLKKAYLNAKAKVESVASAASVIVVNGEKLVMAQMGGYRTILCRDGIAHQLRAKHHYRGKMNWPHKLISGAMRIPKVHIQGCQSRRESSRKQNNSTELITVTDKVDSDTEFLIIASSGVFQVMRNQEAVDLIRHIDDPQEAAECLAREALTRMSRSSISCLVIRFD
ncbi:hypothetical protein RND81_05G061200 [Saponaria officinalis]|uniref:PPM-type phosphatase domain-containing protein n=1 Tax=Saponaria officinalis TaxID=3572 RepID=A0AAW1KVC5_SAPOF